MAVSKRVRAQRIRWALYAVTIIGVVAVLASTDWEHIQEALFQWDTVKEMFPDIVTQAARNTLIFTAFGFSGGLIVGLVIALMRLSSIAPYRWFATGFIEVFRGLPALLTITFIGYGLPIALDLRIPGTYGEGAVALSIVAGAYMAESIRAGIEAVPKGQMEAARSLGMSHSRAMATIIIPQAFRIVIPPLTNELVLLLKDTSLLAILGTTPETEELVTFARDATGKNANATPMVVAGLVFLAMTIPLTQVAAYIERRTKRAR